MSENDLVAIAIGMVIVGLYGMSTKRHGLTCGAIVIGVVAAIALVYRLLGGV